MSSLHLLIQGETIFDDYSGLSIIIADIEIALSILLAINQNSMANFTVGQTFLLAVTPAQAQNQKNQGTSHIITNVLRFLHWIMNTSYK